MSTEHEHDGQGTPHERILNSSEAIECIEKCLDCRRIALQTFGYCVSRGGVYANAALVHLILDCAEAAQLCADWLRRGAALHHQAAALCAQTCQACDERCVGFHDDEDIGKMARACQACAQSCEPLLKPRE